MSDAVIFTFKNEKQIAEAFKRLPLQVVSRGLATSLTAGMKVMKDVAQRNTPHRSGKTLASLRLRSKKADLWTISVFLSTGTWYSRLVESGHRWVVVKAIAKNSKGGTYHLWRPGRGAIKEVVKHGTVAPNPFMERTFDEAKQATSKAIMQRLESYIGTAWARAGHG